MSTAHPAAQAHRAEYDLHSRPLVLVIHRSPFVRQALFVTLDLDGFDVLVAADGAEASALLMEMRPRVVVADLVAADEHMEDFLAHLRSDLEPTRVQIIDFAGNARQSTSASDSDGITSVSSLTSLLDILRRAADGPGPTPGSDRPAA